MSNSTPIIAAHDLRYGYEEAGQRRTVLDGVDIQINKAELVALLGESGSGKSTLLNLLGCIDKPASGRVLIQGTDMQQLAEPHLTLFRRKHIGIIYQLFNLIPTLTVAENIALPLVLSGYGKQHCRDEVSAWLDLVGLPGRDAAFPDQLSGGEQQRVAVARALIHKPALVLADEPTGNLDAQTGQRILDLLVSLARRQQQTLLLVTHSKAVADVADRVLLLEQGKIHHGGLARAW